MNDAERAAREYAFREQGWALATSPFIPGLARPTGGSRSAAGKASRLVSRSPGAHTLRMLQAPAGRTNSPLTSPRALPLLLIRCTELCVGIPASKSRRSRPRSFKPSSATQSKKKAAAGPFRLLGTSSAVLNISCPTLEPYKKDGSMSGTSTVAQWAAKPNQPAQWAIVFKKQQTRDSLCLEECCPFIWDFKAK